MRMARHLLAVGLLAAALIAPPVSAAPTADQLLAKLGATCHAVTTKPLRPKDGAPRSVSVCGMNGAVYAKTGLLVDCDGQRTAQCNEKTDCCFQNDTAFHQSDGQPLNAAALPYIVLPEDSGNWHWPKQGIDGGSVAAVIYDDHLTYAVVGDTDVPDKVPQGSYATAKALGMNPDPRHGGVDGGVTYLIFENATADPIESHANAVTVGQRAAEAFLAHN